MASFDLLEKRNISDSKVPGKYAIGEKDDQFVDIRKRYPSFSFEYACMDKDKFSFNYTGISSRDYAKLIDGLKNVSQHTYERLNDEYCFHFHEVKWDAVTRNLISTSVSQRNTKGKKTSPYTSSRYSKRRGYSDSYTAAFSMPFYSTGSTRHTTGIAPQK